MLRERHDETAFDVLQVGPSDAYLQHFLGVHADRHRPATSPASPPPSLHDEDLAFQVEKGDETVGVVLIRRDGDIARVLLDYVTPRYRDFSPGEFVWRRAPRLRERGFRKVAHPARHGRALLRPARPGFRREGASYVLDL